MIWRASSEIFIEYHLKIFRIAFLRFVFQGVDLDCYKAIFLKYLLQIAFQRLSGPNLFSIRSKFSGFGQFFSSSPLTQFSSPSQYWSFGIHSKGNDWLFSWIHWNWFASLQVWRQFFSSEPSWQSLIPSHFLRFSIHSRGKSLPPT